MSIKVYDGLISTENGAFETGLALRKAVEPIFMEKFTKMLALLLAAEVGKQWSDYGFENNSLIEPDEEGISAYHRKELIQRKLYRLLVELHENPVRSLSEADFGYDLFLIPNGVAGGNPLVRVFSEDREYRAALIEAGVVKNYGYWDNTDADEDVSPEEWAERKQAWSRVYDHSPSEVGLSVPMLSTMGIALWDINHPEGN